MSEQGSSDVTPQRRLAVRAVLRTDVGLVRAENQDFGMLTTAEEETDSHPGGRLLIVADGMGGHRGGATASRLAAETVKAQYLGSETADIPIALRDSLARANSRIFHEAQANPELRGMGTTTSALAVRNGKGWFAHVGDSRIYMVREGEIRQLTDDHSLVATMVREGLLTSAEAETHPRRNVLQRSMGVAEDVEIDVRGPFEVREGDTFILCSDGLHGVVKEPELREIAALPIDVAADEYMRRALERGAPDNVTVIVARVEPAGDDEAGAVFTAGDETLAEVLEETHRVGAVDPAQFDETLKESPLSPHAGTEPGSVSRGAAVRDTAPTLEIAPPPPSAAPTPEDEGGTVMNAWLPQPEDVQTEEVVIEPRPVPTETREVAAPAAENVPPTQEVPIPSEAAAAADISNAQRVPGAPAPSVAADAQNAPLPNSAPAGTPAPAAKSAPGAQRSALRWVIVWMVVLGGAAGAWFYWNQQQGTTNETRPATSSSR